MQGAREPAGRAAFPSPRPRLRGAHCTHRAVLSAEVEMAALRGWETTDYSGELPHTSLLLPTTKASRLRTFQ